MNKTTKNWLAKRHQKHAIHDLSAFSTNTGEDLINLSIGDPDFHTPLPIINAAFDDAKSGHTHYTDGRGQEVLRQAICEDLQQSFCLSISVEQCMVTTSACHAMWLVLESVLDDGDEVIVFSPYFPPYVDQIKLARGVPVDCPTNSDKGFAINIERFKKCITKKTKAVIINTPNNPVGNCYDKKQLEQIAEIVTEYDLLLIADDIYTAFSYESPHIAIATLPQMGERTITLGSFSKNYCMTGWRIGYTVAPEAIIKTMEAINQNVIFSPPSISQRAAIHAIRLKQQIQPEIIETIKQRALTAHRVLNAIDGITCRPTAGGMYIFPKVSGAGMTGGAFAKFALEKANVRVIAGEAFGSAGAGHVRIALTVSEDRLIRAGERLEKALRER